MDNLLHEFDESFKGNSDRFLLPEIGMRFRRSLGRIGKLRLGRNLSQKG